jgi:UDP-N-acetylmuramoyl-tripeptide--D-alanyl-D-alanine ligase
MPAMPHIGQSTGLIGSELAAPYAPRSIESRLMPSAPTLADQARAAIAAPVPALRLTTGVAAATLHRRRLTGVAFIGVTGSCGKTTTKELIAGALRTELRGRNSPGEGNGLAVVTKTVLRTTARDAFCVIEMALENGSLARAARVVRPRIAVVTTIGTDHRAILRTLEATAAAKRELVDAVVDGGTVVLNADDPHVIAMAERFPGRVITFGSSPSAMLRAAEIRSSWPEPLSFTLHHRGRSRPVRTRLHGKHWVPSVLGAIGAAVAMEVPLGQALAGLSAVPPTPGRMCPVPCGGATIVCDGVKAPSWTFDALLEFIAEARATRKIVVIGTISDYPGSASTVYRRVAGRALQVADEVIFAGPQAPRALRATRGPGAGSLLTFATAREAVAHVTANLREDDLVLLKGSERTDGLHRILFGGSERFAPMAIGSRWRRS